MASSSVVLPTPGPPVMTVAFDASASRSASAWRWRQRQSGRLLDAGECAVGVDLRPGWAPRHQFGEALGDCPLGAVQPAQERARRAGDGIGDDCAFGDLEADGVVDQRVGDSEQLGRQRAQLVVGQSAVAFLPCFVERVADAGAHADLGGLLDPEPAGDLVGHLEANAADVAREAVGVAGHDLDGVAAVGLEDAHRAGRARAVGVQEDHDLADGSLLGPRVGDPLRAERADAVDLAQPFGLVLDDVEHLVLEGQHELGGVDPADAAYRARAQVLLDVLAGGRRRAADEVRLELRAVLRVVAPLAGGRDPFAGGCRGGVAGDGDRFAMASGLDLQDAESVLGAVEPDVLDQAGQDLAPGRLRWRLVACVHDVCSARNVLWRDKGTAGCVMRCVAGSAGTPLGECRLQAALGAFRLRELLGACWLFRVRGQCTVSGGSRISMDAASLSTVARSMSFGNCSSGTGGSSRSCLKRATSAWQTVWMWPASWVSSSG